MARKASKGKSGPQLCRPDGAGIDIGSRQHWVAVAEDRDAEPVRSFGTVTSELHRLADWLLQCGITSVAMESTGIYWVPLYEILEQRGMEVLLVNASHVKNVPGRKSDVLDCQWLQQLHSYGLLRGSFRPTSEIVELRTYMRQRQTLVESAAREIHHLQRSLLLMNIQLHHVVNDITGKTGMRIVRALASGNYNPKELASYRDRRCHASEEQIAAALQGNYQPEHVFVLKQALDLYDAYQERLAECDARIEQTLAALAIHRPEPLSERPAGKRSRASQPNQPRFEIRDPVHRITGGADLTQIPAIGNLTALNLLAEIGLDMTRWRTEKHFVSWLNLAPGTHITGGSVVTARRRAIHNRAGMVLRQAALSLGRTSTALGAFYRRLAARRGKGKALVATARKLACLIYRLLRYGGEYVEQGIALYEARYQQRKIANLQRTAKSLGFHLTPTPPPT